MKPIYEGRDLEAMSFARNYHLWILDEFRAYLGPFIVEVGAGTGDFSELLLRTSADRLIAIEPSENLAPELSNRFADDPRVEVHCTYFAYVAPTLQREPHAVIYVNVLEHIDHDQDELAAVYDALRPGGHVCIFVPAIRRLYSAFDASVGHYRRYERPGLIELVRSSGFDVVKAKYMDMIGVLPWYFAYTLGGRKLVASHVAIYDKLIVPWLRSLERVVGAPIGKNLIVVGKKPISFRKSVEVTTTKAEVGRRLASGLMTPFITCSVKQSTRARDTLISGYPRRRRIPISHLVFQQLSLRRFFYRNHSLQSKS